MDLQTYIARFESKFKELEQQLSQPDFYQNPRKAQEITREHNRIKQALADASQLKSLEKNLQSNRELISKPEDPELTQMAEEEIPHLEQQIAQYHQKVMAALVPPDPADSRNTIVEIRAGAGGMEAALFVGDIYRMYSRYAERTGWKLETMDSSLSEMGGYKEIIFQLNGQEVYRKMRYESGVHRVQRVPATENQGRIHTSTVTVAVLPEVEDVDVVIKPEELRIEVCRSGGPGGQGVNTTDSAVQILHIPTGMIVRCQDGRSQLKNKDKAMQVLRARLYEMKKREEEEKYAANRRQQVGTGERNEKIRTYNYPQNRVTDHRINFTSHNLTGIMDGDIDEVLEQLVANDLADKLKQLDQV